MIGKAFTALLASTSIGLAHGQNGGSAFSIGDMKEVPCGLNKHAGACYLGTGTGSLTSRTTLTVDKLPSPLPEIFTKESAHVTKGAPLTEPFTFTLSKIATPVNPPLCEKNAPEGCERYVEEHGTTLFASNNVTTCAILSVPENFAGVCSTPTYVDGQQTIMKVAGSVGVDGEHAVLVTVESKAKSFKIPPDYIAIAKLEMLSRVEKQQEKNEKKSTAPVSQYGGSPFAIRDMKQVPCGLDKHDGVCYMATGTGSMTERTTLTVDQLPSPLPKTFTGDTVYFGGAPLTEPFTFTLNKIGSPINPPLCDENAPEGCHQFVEEHGLTLFSSNRDLYCTLVSVPSYFAAVCLTPAYVSGRQVVMKLSGSAAADASGEYAVLVTLESRAKDYKIPSEYLAIAKLEMMSRMQKEAEKKEEAAARLSQYGGSPFVIGGMKQVPCGIDRHNGACFLATGTGSMTERTTLTVDQLPSPLPETFTGDTVYFGGAPLTEPFTFTLNKIGSPINPPLCDENAPEGCHQFVEEHGLTLFSSNRDLYCTLVSVPSYFAAVCSTPAYVSGRQVVMKLSGSAAADASGEYAVLVTLESRAKSFTIPSEYIALAREEVYKRLQKGEEPTVFSLVEAGSTQVDIATAHEEDKEFQCRSVESVWSASDDSPCGGVRVGQ
uniref:Uncharacterized protein n=1 Tax=Chromera velia CCMP2878 TaxID=1169474 RepID=A0A0G4HBV3_9ALVE|eukprot:Cvel_933.t1-p1 / transcript=Cvel_933.t1 / gene=Cvel_933 / organism=Chromera_velia_CCMP2878 / gene_product=hypothetical protein / transcript_product=hypothetical protein / location=Cvel_scaffold29:154975-157904(+) / protein_length=660 / sequence_SO=supercontig / SO=protein_coding / is_pseudo=false